MTIGSRKRVIALGVLAPSVLLGLIFIVPAVEAGVSSPQPAVVCPTSLPAGDSVWVEYNTSTGWIESIGIMNNGTNLTPAPGPIYGVTIKAVQVNASIGLEMRCFMFMHPSSALPWKVDLSTGQIIATDPTIISSQVVLWSKAAERRG